MGNLLLIFRWGLGMGSATFGARLRELRVAAGLTQPELGSKAGVEKGTISRIERGERSPTWETVIALATALGVSCEAFNEAAGLMPTPTRGRPRKAHETPAIEPNEQKTPKAQ